MKMNTGLLVLLLAFAPALAGAQAISGGGAPPAAASSGFTAGKDLSGTSTSQTVNSASGAAFTVTGPVDSASSVTIHAGLKISSGALTIDGNVASGATIKGNVTIGTTTIFNLSQKLLVQGANIGLVPNSNNSGLTLIVPNDTTDAGTSLSFATNDQTTNSSQNPTFRATISGHLTNSSGYGGYLQFNTKNPSATITEGMRLDQNQFLGIGTASPATKLHMSSGTLTVDGTGGNLSVSGTSGLGYEVITNACGAGVTTCTATCTGSKVILGGGCTSTVALLGDGGGTTSWTCSSTVGTITAVAYCARLGP